MSEYDDWKQENDRWEAYLYPNGVLRNKLGNYLRTRGEYVSYCVPRPLSVELPSHTRRIHCTRPQLWRYPGTTSAYAENTHACTIAGSSAGNYLRVRGEYACAMASAMRRVELPPRTRRILSPAGVMAQSVGTTSAYAENTGQASNIPPPGRNYLRVRGEYHQVMEYAHKLGELPPRTRRIHSETELIVHLLRTTSAYAENTDSLPHKILSIWNYLRVRGEYSFHTRYRVCVRELPPRARRILLR